VHKVLTWTLQLQLSTIVTYQYGRWWPVVHDCSRSLLYDLEPLTWCRKSIEATAWLGLFTMNLKQLRLLSSHFGSTEPDVRTIFMMVIKWIMPDSEFWLSTVMTVGQSLLPAAIPPLGRFPPWLKLFIVYCDIVPLFFNVEEHMGFGDMVRDKIYVH
jgi:hypothetical protein